MGALEGVGVVITRAATQSAGLSQLLLDRGATVHVLPMLKYQRVVAPEQGESLARLETYRWIVFTSANAVEFCSQAIESDGIGIETLKQHKLASIGPATTTALEEQGLAVAFESQGQSGASLAQELAEADSDLVGASILLPRSRLADDELPQALTQAGAQVQELIVYDTLPETCNAEELRMLIKGAQAGAILFASPSAVDATLAALGEGARALLQSLKVFSIGPKTSACCAEHQIALAGEAKAHTSAGLVDAIVGYFAGQ